MEKHPDKIFRNKLENYQRTAPASAWDRVEGNLQSKYDFRKLWKYAAAILVIVLAGFIVNQNGSVDHFQNAGNDMVVDEPLQHEPERVPPLVQTPTSEELESDVKNNKSVQLEKKPMLETRTSNRQPLHNAPTEEVSQQTIEFKYDDSTTIISNVESIEEKEIIRENAYATIVYSKEEVDQRFLRKNQAEKKSLNKPLKKQSEHSGLIATSKSNNNQTIGLGNLRQLKDDFFSFGFLAQDDKSQKSKIQ